MLQRLKIELEHASKAEGDELASKLESARATARAAASDLHSAQAKAKGR
jgi:hypothetical protein